MIAASLVGYMSGEVAGRDVDHDDDDDDDDDDEKGQWNRSIASLRSELRPAPRVCRLAGMVLQRRFLAPLTVLLLMKTLEMFMG